VLGSLKGLAATFVEFFKPVVTAQYPKEHLPVAPRWMGFPVLTWDAQVEEPYCTGCMVCIRYCPTECMSATMKDNPLHAEGKSKRRKIIDKFEINYGRCIVCGICVDVCNFDAFARNDNRADLGRLLQLGQEYQDSSGWRPKEDTAGEEEKGEATT